MQESERKPIRGKSDGVSDKFNSGGFLDTLYLRCLWAIKLSNSCSIVEYIKIKYFCRNLVSGLV